MKSRNKYFIGAYVIKVDHNTADTIDDSTDALETVSECDINDEISDIN